MDVGEHPCVHMCVQVTEQLHGSFLNAFHVILGTKSLIERGAHPLGWSSRSASPLDPPGSTSPVLASQVPASAPGF